VEAISERGEKWECDRTVEMNDDCTKEEDAWAGEKRKTEGKKKDCQEKLGWHRRHIATLHMDFGSREGEVCHTGKKSGELEG